MKALNKAEAIILGLLWAIDKPVVRTKLVKMIYLLDNSRYEQLEHTMTGFQYHWDRFGPNAVGNAITHTLADLGGKGVVCMTQKMTPYENFAYSYRAIEVEAQKLPLADSDWVSIRGIVNQYGSMRREQVVSESKKTLPVQSAKQGDILKFQTHPGHKRLRDSFFADADFVELTREGMASTEGRISLSELRAEVAQSADV